MMIWFRCYSCWHLTGYAGPKESIDCVRCSVNLFTGALPMKTIHSANQESEEHESLVHRLSAILAKNNAIYEGVSEYIANETTRHKPDAIYYRQGSAYMTQPIIYEVLASNFVMDENAISRCKLFMETAQNRLSHFYLAIPEIREKETIEKILKEYGILATGIMVLGDEHLI